MWDWASARSSRRSSLTSVIGLPLLLLACWFLWKWGYQALAVIIFIAGVASLIWLQWALWSAQLKPWAGRSTMAMNDPVYDIPLQDQADVPSNPAADPLYDIEDHDFSDTLAKAESEPDPGVPLPSHDEEPPSAAS
ncbi:MAG TPA: hypothetical protein VGG68_08700 [Caulobacteraceae bacterium]